MTTPNDFYQQVQKTAEELNYKLYQYNFYSSWDSASYRYCIEDEFLDKQNNYIEFKDLPSKITNNSKAFDKAFKAYPETIIVIFSTLCKKDKSLFPFIIKNHKEIFSLSNNSFFFLEQISVDKKDFINFFKLLPKSVITIFNMDIIKLNDLCNSLGLSFEEKDTLFFNFFQNREKQFNKSLSYYNIDQLSQLKDDLLEIYHEKKEYLEKYCSFFPLLKSDNIDLEDIHIFKETPSTSIFIDLKQLFNNFPIRQWSIEYSYVPKIEEICKIIKEYYKFNELIVNNCKNKIISATFFHNDPEYNEKKLKTEFINMMIEVQKNPKITNMELKSFLNSCILKNSLEKSLTQGNEVKNIRLKKI